MSRIACSACHGNKKCADCDGTGTNPHLNESEPKCRACSGTGVCAVCEGTGLSRVPPQEIFDPGFNKL